MGMMRAMQSGRESTDHSPTAVNFIPNLLKYQIEDQATTIEAMEDTNSLDDGLRSTKTENAEEICNGFARNLDEDLAPQVGTLHRLFADDPLLVKHDATQAGLLLPYAPHHLEKIDDPVVGEAEAEIFLLKENAWKPNGRDNWKRRIAVGRTYKAKSTHGTTLCRNT